MYVLLTLMGISLHIHTSQKTSNMLFAAPVQSSMSRDEALEIFGGVKPEENLSAKAALLRSSVSSNDPARKTKLDKINQAKKVLEQKPSEYDIIRKTESPTTSKSLSFSFPGTPKVKEPIPVQKMSTPVQETPTTSTMKMPLQITPELDKLIGKEIKEEIEESLPSTPERRSTDRTFDTSYSQQDILEQRMREFEEKLKREYQEKAQREYEEKIRREYEEKTKQAAIEKVRQEAIEQTKREFEEKARLEAEAEKTRLEAIAKLKESGKKKIEAKQKELGQKAISKFKNFTQQQKDQRQYEADNLLPKRSKKGLTGNLLTYKTTQIVEQIMYGEKEPTEQLLKELTDDLEKNYTFPINQIKHLLTIINKAPRSDVAKKIIKALDTSKALQGNKLIEHHGQWTIFSSKFDIDHAFKLVEQIAQSSYSDAEQARKLLKNEVSQKTKPTNQEIIKILDKLLQTINIQSLNAIIADPSTSILEKTRATVAVKEIDAVLEIFRTILDKDKEVIFVDTNGFNMKEININNAYHILGVDRNASQEAIEKIFAQKSTVETVKNAYIEIALYNILHKNWDISTSLQVSLKAISIDKTLDINPKKISSLKDIEKAYDAKVASNPHKKALYEKAKIKAEILYQMHITAQLGEEPKETLAKYFPQEKSKNIATINRVLKTQRNRLAQILSEAVKTSPHDKLYLKNLLTEALDNELLPRELPSNLEDLQSEEVDTRQAIAAPQKGFFERIGNRWTS